METENASQSSLQDYNLTKIKKYYGYEKEELVSSGEVLDRPCNIFQQNPKFCIIQF